MSLGRLWAGWRSDYVGGANTANAPAAPDPAADDEAQTAASDGDADGAEACVFCRILTSGEPDADTLVVRRARDVVAILNAYPYNNGHLLVMPNRHVADLEALTAAEAAELWATVTDGVRAVKAAYRPEGVNVGLNLGRAAGAGLPAHLHVHLLPRWNGDTNFMTTVADVRVLPETLASSWDRLGQHWPAPASR